MKPRVVLFAVITFLFVSLFFLACPFTTTFAQPQLTTFTFPFFSWVKTWGGSLDESAKNIVMDGSGNLYVVGEFSGTVNFDSAEPNPSATITSHFNTVDAYCVKLDASGAFQWVRTFGNGRSGDIAPNSRDAANGVAVDPSGNVYVSGLYQGTVDFGSGFVFTSNAQIGYNNIFVAKLAPNGTTQWVKTWGGNTGGESYSVAVDPAGYVYVQGDWSGVTCDFNPQGPVHDVHTNHGFYDAFLSKFDLSGNFQWAKTWGGEGYDDGPGVTVDGLGNVYVGGMYGSQNINFDPAGGAAGLGHPAQDSSVIYVDVFLSKFDSGGNLLWVQTWGGQGTEDAGEVVAVDSANNVYVGGRFACTNCNLNPSGTPDLHSSNGDRDAFLSKYDSGGNFLWARTWGGNGWDAIGSLSVDGSNNIYTTGVFSSTVPVDFNPAPNITDFQSAKGAHDVFFNKFDSNGNLQWVKTWGGPGEDYGLHGIADNVGSVFYVVGSFNGTVAFDPGAGNSRTVSGKSDAFLSKFISVSLSPSVFLPITIRRAP